MWGKAKEGTKRGKLTSWLEFRMCAFVAWAPDPHHRIIIIIRIIFEINVIILILIVSKWPVPWCSNWPWLGGYAVCGAPLSETICTFCIGVALNTGLFTNFERIVGNIIMKNDWLDFVLILGPLDRTGDFLCLVEDTLGGSNWYFVLILLDWPWQWGFIPC